MQRFIRLTPVAGMLGFLALWLVGCGALVTSAPAPIKDTGSTAITRPFTTASTTRTIYSNALTQQAAGWANSPTCVFTGSGLSVRPGGGQAYICLAPTSPVADMTVSVTVQQKSGPKNHAFGIVFHHAAPKNYYFFGIDGNGRFTTTVVVNDVSHIVIPFTPNPAIHVGANATNRLQVIAKGQTMTFLVNSVPVGQVTFSTFASGMIGLRGINNGEVIFQQLSISSL